MDKPTRANPQTTIYSIQLHQELSSGWKIFRCRCFFSRPQIQSGSFLFHGLKVGTTTKEGTESIVRILKLPSSNIVELDGPAAASGGLKVGDILCKLSRASWRPKSLDEDTKERQEAMQEQKGHYDIFFAQPPAAAADPQDAAPQAIVSMHKTPQEQQQQQDSKEPNEASNTSQAQPETTPRNRIRIKVPGKAPSKRKATPVSTTRVPKSPRQNTTPPPVRRTVTPTPNLGFRQALDHLDVKKQHDDLVQKIQAERLSFQSLKSSSQKISLKLLETVNSVSASEIIRLFDQFQCPAIPPAVVEPTASKNDDDDNEDNDEDEDVTQILVEYINTIVPRISELSSCLADFRRINQNLQIIHQESIALMNAQTKHQDALQHAHTHANESEIALANAQTTLDRAKDQVEHATNRMHQHQEATTQHLKAMADSLKSAS